MTTKHKGYRLDTDLLDRIDAWAEEHGTTEAEAVRSLLALALERDGPSDGADTDTADHDGEAEALRRELATLKAQADTWHEQKAMLGDHIATLKEQTYTLTAQVAEKDRQIERLQDITEHSQILQAAHVAGTLRDAKDDTEPDTQPKGVWAWLARKMGR